ncbi:MAG: site-specific integrase [Phycisphaerales bacterium]|nr:site-specific integrase [Phycisphaerales bacterium]MCI0629998.1 site-specific integrase [Phycisphaerales bacterium]MCI0677232.1 site-specific integrase [Phycisphaerales bacterium]
MWPNPDHRAGRGPQNYKPRSRPKPRRRFPPEVLSDEEVRALLAACGGSTTGIRNQALLAMLYRGGLRIREALSLWPKDLDLANGAVRVLHAKGGKSRTNGLDPGAVAFVERWLAARQRWSVKGTHPVFCTRTGAAMTDGYVRRLLPALAQLAGIHKRVHAHGFRHTHAAQLRTEGVDIGIISKQLGHQSIATTARYLDHLAPVAVLEVIRQRPWVMER